MRVRVLVTGATGFVGRRLCPALGAHGHEVVAMTRNPDTYRGVGRAVGADVHDPETLPSALADCDVAYYLVHSLGQQDFMRLDADAALGFGRAAAAAGVSRIVYLGGLGSDDDQLSPHLRSRREVEALLGGGGVPVTSLRAGVIVGHGGASWEITRQLVDRLPAMVAPRWLHTRTQPIALGDVIRYLVGVLDHPETTGTVLEIGGPDVMKYRDMLKRLARLKGRPLPIIGVPLLTPQLSSLWLALVTDVDTRTGRTLVDSMINEVVVRDDTVRRVLPFELMPFDEAVAEALADREQEQETA